MISILDRCRVDAVIFGVRANELNKDNGAVVVNRYDQAVFISGDIKDHAFGIDDTRVPKGFLDLTGVLPMD